MKFRVLPRRGNVRAIDVSHEADTNLVKMAFFPNDTGTPPALVALTLYKDDAEDFKAALVYLMAAIENDHHHDSDQVAVLGGPGDR